MNAVPESIIVNSCQYTPVYLIQDPGATQGQSYFIAQSSLEDPKPVGDNLKSFYESSGSLENGLVNVNNSTKPRILKKQDGAVGNNLKLASFLLPKNENTAKQHYVVNVLKPTVSTNNTHPSVNNNIHANSANGVHNHAPNTANSSSTINTVPKLNMDSKIVRLKDTTFNATSLKSRYSRVEKPSPKIKPKELPPILQGAPSKHTSVQLLKLGETYHSLNQLSDEQMKMVSQALKMFSNPQKVVPEPAYDPVTNTKFIYKVVSPRDLTVVGKNKVVTLGNDPENMVEGIIKADIKKELLTKIDLRKDTTAKELINFMKIDPRKEIIAKDHINIAKIDARKEIIAKEHINVTKLDPRKEIGKEHIKKDMEVRDGIKRESVAKEVVKKENVQKHDKKDLLIKKNEQRLERQRIIRELMEQKEIDWMDEIESREPQVTRSGRKVKLPKLSFPEGVTAKPKRKNTCVPCFQCSAEFPSLYRLQKHYQTHPTHVPTKIHSNLFHCLLAIVKGASDENQTNIFIQQLEQLIVKLRSLLPCLLKTTDNEGKSCTVSEDVGRLLGLNPGNFKLNVEALNCNKNKDGFCKHNPPPNDLQPENDGTQCRITMNNEDIVANSEAATDDCARINSVEKWPSVSKRVWKQKRQKTLNAKRMRLASENGDAIIELGTDNAIVLGNPLEPDESSAIINDKGAEQKADEGVVIKIECNNITEQKLYIPNIAEEQPENNSTFEQPRETNALIKPVDQRNHAQFYSTHFDIRSSPIKTSSTSFQKFQINPEILAKYEAQIIRSIETVDKNHDNSNIPCPTVEEVLQTSENVLENSSEILTSDKDELPIDSDLLQPTQDVLHACRGVLHINENGLQSSQDIHTDNDVLHNHDVMTVNGDATDVLTNDDTLQEIFRDEDLSAVKESFILDRELKDWILNRSNDDKSEDGFSKSTSLIEPSLLHLRDEIKSNTLDQKDDLPTNDNHDESSVLNFLDTLATDCLAYPGTEIRTNNGEFQLDLFSFHSS